MYIIPEYSSKIANETYHGLVLTLQDALLVLEATRQNVLPIIKRRLNDIERSAIVLGSVFAWSESKCGMKRWTDGKSWLASKIKGPFLIYNEQDNTKNNLPDGLVKQSFSLITKQNEKLNLVCYYNARERAEGLIQGKIPSEDPLLRNLQLDLNVYLKDVLQYKLPGFAKRTAPRQTSEPQFARDMQMDYQQLQPFTKPLPVFEPKFSPAFYSQQQFLPNSYTPPTAHAVPNFQQPSSQPHPMHMVPQGQQPLPQQHPSLYAPRTISVPQIEPNPMTRWSSTAVLDMAPYASSYPSMLAPPQTAIYQHQSRISSQPNLLTHPSPNFTYSPVPARISTHSSSVGPQLDANLNDSTQKIRLPSILPHVILCTSFPPLSVHNNAGNASLIK